IILKEGRVETIKPAGRAKPDFGAKSALIAPTLFDIQVNGANGIDLQSKNITPEEVCALNDFLASQGVSHWIPTIITGSTEDMIHGCKVIAEAMSDAEIRRAIPGIHIEGPYISPEDGPRGAHDKKHVRHPSLEEFEEFMRVAKGRIAYITVAPEVEGAIPFIREVVKRKVRVALGHHNASPVDIERAVAAGAVLSTHLGNGIAGTVHRHHNPLWPQLANDHLKASLIADLDHLPGDVLGVFVRAKQPRRVILTSDSIHLAGLKPGTYKLGGTPVEMLPSGRVCLSGTDYLAGSSLLLLNGVINAYRVTDLTLKQAFACASSIPGRGFGLKHRFVLPKEGAKANFVVFTIVKSSRGWRPNLKAVFIGGQQRGPVRTPGWK
ncbi:MAG: amidohydrolase family protein, partial [Candidatus Hydrogenedentes bacterium]|nr:amidohydrolase family protein [Candidatus Hydrogenedentota bacterium]